MAVVRGAAAREAAATAAATVAVKAVAARVAAATAAARLAAATAVGCGERDMDGGGWITAMGGVCVWRECVW